MFGKKVVGFFHIVLLSKQKNLVSDEGITTVQYQTSHQFNFSWSKLTDAVSIT